MTSVPTQHVLKQQAYILFYSKVQATRTLPEKRAGVAGSSQHGPLVKSDSSSNSSSGSVEKRAGVAGSSQHGPLVKSDSSSSSSSGFSSNNISKAAHESVVRGSESAVALIRERTVLCPVGPTSSLSCDAVKVVTGSSSTAVKGPQARSLVFQETLTCPTGNRDVFKSSTESFDITPLSSSTLKSRNLKQMHLPKSIVFGDSSGKIGENVHSVSLPLLTKMVVIGSSHLPPSDSRSSSTKSAVGGALNGVLRKRDVRLKAARSSRSRFLSQPFRYVSSVLLSVMQPITSHLADRNKIKLCLLWSTG